jgi:hypothetical protein
MFYYFCFFLNFRTNIIVSKKMNNGGIFINGNSGRVGVGVGDKVAAAVWLGIAIGIVFWTQNSVGEEV